MCTATWWQDKAAYSLLFNRDERRTRPLAEPPQQRTTPQGIRYIAPYDPEGGGTWIAVNEYRLTLALLNYYDARATTTTPAPHSRGLLVAALCEAKHLAHMHELLSAIDLGRYHPFHLLAIATNADPIQYTWDGTKLHHKQAATLTATSSWETQEVLAWRQQSLAHAKAQNADQLEAWHQRYDPKHPKHSPCMTRDDARTVSFTRIDVGKTITLKYAERIGNENTWGDLSTCELF